MVLFLDLTARHFGRRGRQMEDAAEVEASRLPMFDALLRVEQVGASDQFIEGADTQLRHDLARFFGDEEEEVHHMLGPALEFRTQHRVLRGHAHRTGVEVALAHHDAALDDERRGREAELVGAEQGADDDVAPGLHLAVGLHADAPAQAVQHQGLLRLGEAQFPRRAGMLDRAPWRRASAAVVAGDDDMIGLGFGDAGSDRADADFADQLHADARPIVGVLQVVDQLREVFDRIDVVVRRRRDQTDPRHRVTQEADVVADLAARQLAALAGLRALRHLDLQLVGRDEVLRRDAEAARRDLLDLRAQRVAVLQFVVGNDDFVADDFADLGAVLDRDALQLIAIARRVFAAFAGIALTADAVHRHRERAVRFGADRAERHCTSREALDDLARRLDLVDGNRLARIELEFEQPAQRHVAARLVVDDLSVFLVGLELVGARAVLQLGDCVGRPHVLFAANAPRVFAAGVEHALQHRVVAEGGQVHADRFLGDFEHADAADLRCRAAKVLVDERDPEPAEEPGSRGSAVRGRPRRRALVGVGLRRGVHAGVQRHLRGRGRPPDLEDAADARAHDARPGPDARRRGRGDHLHRWAGAPTRSRRPGPRSCASLRAPGAGARPTARATRESPPGHGSSCGR